MLIREKQMQALITKNSSFFLVKKLVLLMYNVDNEKKSMLHSTLLKIKLLILHYKM